MCTVTVYYSAVSIPGTPSEGNSYDTQSYSIDVPDGTWIGEMVSAGSGFSPCPRVAQFWVQARNPVSAEILGRANTNTCAAVAFLSYKNSCTANYDCINGQCVQSTTYSTTGLYQSLAHCQAVCANGGACGSGKQCIDPTNFCPDGKVCIDQGEFASIEALISKINSEVC